MRIRHHIFFSAGEESGGWARLRSILDRADCAEFSPENRQFRMGSPLNRTAHVRLCLDEGDARLAKLNAILNEEDISPFTRREHIYTRKELRSASYLELSFVVRERSIARLYREQFDFTHACARCGCGARQVQPLRISAGGLPKSGLICQTDECVKLVAGKIHDALRAMDLKSLLLMKVESLDGRKLDWFQLVATETLPPIAPETKGLIRDTSLQACPLCGRDNHFHTATHPLELAYRQSDLAGVAPFDAAYTYECMGIGAIKARFEHSHIATGMLVVSQRVLCVFQDLKVRGVQFVPVQLI